MAPYILLGKFEFYNNAQNMILRAECLIRDHNICNLIKGVFG